MYLNNSKKIVIKLGSSTVIDSNGKFKKPWINSLIKDIKKFHKNKDIVIVSSGAIAMGLKDLKIKKKVKIEMSQAVASIGQIHLAREFQEIFIKSKIKIGQILITPDDTEKRRRAINIRRTFDNLFKIKAIPIVNENDTTATTEIKYGDNDRLAARVAQIINADTLIIFSDVDGLYNKSLKKKNLVKEVKKIDDKIYSYVEKNINNYGKGGMMTKLQAAEICMESGCQMFLANGKYNFPIKSMFERNKFTRFVPKISKLDAKKKWILSSLETKGEIHVDNGASKAISNSKSLLAAGVLRIAGKFQKGDNITIMINNKSLAKGISSFSSTEIDKIKGVHSDNIEGILGYSSKSEIVHKDDMVLV